MIDEVRQLAIAYQHYAADNDLGIGDLAEYQYCIETLADMADPSGELTEELEENGVI